MLARVWLEAPLEQAVVILVALGALTAGAEALVRGASFLALRAGISPLFVGLTIVGFGTSSPELGASLAATLGGSVDISVGNVVGSNIFNIAIILGMTATVHPIRIRLSAIRRDYLVALAAACVPFIGLAFGGVLPRGLGVVMLASLALYLTLAFRADRRASAADQKLAGEEVRSTMGIGTWRRLLDRVWVNAVFVLAGFAFLILGARAFVGAATDLARGFGISELVIGLTIVSAGTSLPELVTSLSAARRKNPDIAIGNVIGSNIFNMLGILGTCAVVRAQGVAGPLLAVDVPVMLLATLALVPILRTGGIISRKEGWMLLAGYAVYLVALILRG